MKDILIVCNPNSGKGISVSVLQDYYNMLEDVGYSVDMVFTKRPQHATEIVQNAKGYDTVISFGGDGTLNEVVRGNSLRKDSMNVLPISLGSCNDVASMFGYIKSPTKNLKLAMTGEVKSIDIGTINEEPFTYVVGMGKFMNISYETSRNKKSRSGYLAYIKEGVKEFFDTPKSYQAQIEADGIKLEDDYSLIMVSNSNHIAGVSNVYKDVELDDEKLELLLCKSTNNSDLLFNFAMFYLGMKPKNIVCIKANDIKIKLNEIPDKNWCIDGEKLSYNTKEYHIKANKRMDFIIPKEKINRLFREDNAINR